VGMVWKHAGSPYGREVKNLGWLLKHADKVHTAHVVKYNDGVTSSAAMLVVELRDHVYATSFGSFDLCLQWLDRPSMDGVLVRVTTDVLHDLPGPIDRYRQRYKVGNGCILTQDGYELRRECRPTYPERSRDRVRSILARRTAG